MYVATIMSNTVSSSVKGQWGFECHVQRNWPVHPSGVWHQWLCSAKHCLHSHPSREGRLQDGRWYCPYGQDVAEKAKQRDSGAWVEEEDGAALSPAPGRAWRTRVSRKKEQFFYSLSLECCESIIGSWRIFLWEGGVYVKLSILVMILRHKKL